MGIFSGLLGNASKKDNDKVERQLENILIPGEQVDLAYVLVRDLIVFTEKPVMTERTPKSTSIIVKLLKLLFRLLFRILL